MAERLGFGDEIRLACQTTLLGDVAFSKAGLQLLALLNGKKRLIRGNHDHYKLSAYQEFFQEINSDKFLSFLRAITGIAPLYADPALTGGGLHEVHNGGFLKIHTDFNCLRSTQKHRALNLMLYLNPDWQEEWGGWHHAHYPESVEMMRPVFRVMKAAFRAARRGSSNPDRADQVREIWKRRGDEG
ncbi:MAG: 2OG-Fe(II) oxygenase [Proteobacteria bacterium]|nr:2OG-Fe(II) oxygenase [Pseudomonadota bacterium]